VDTREHCGGKIIFRVIDGARIPIHLSGGCWKSSGRRSSSSSGGSGSLYGQYSVRGDIFVSNHSNSNFCRCVRCPICKKDVFFIRHNGGSVWVDELGWPWPKHPCFHKDSEGDRSLRVLRANTQDRQIKPMLGLVIRIKVNERPEPVTTFLAINCEDGKGRCISISGRGKILIGQLVALDQNFSTLESADSISYKVIRNDINPTELGLNSKWLEDCWYQSTPKTIKEVNDLTHCPQCNAMIKPERLHRHIRRVHGTHN
jgi:hypothetical protein